MYIPVPLQLVPSFSLQHYQPANNFGHLSVVQLRRSCAHRASTAAKKLGLPSTASELYKLVGEDVNKLARHALCPVPSAIDVSGHAVQYPCR